MLRFVNICLFLGLVALAYVIYQVKYEARGLDEEIAGLSKSIESERDGIAVLRAEWSLLNRPERIERLAQKYLKLNPASPRQLIALDQVSPADLARVPLLAKQEPAQPIVAKPVVAKITPKTTPKPAPKTAVQASAQ